MGAVRVLCRRCRRSPIAVGVRQKATGARTETVQRRPGIRREDSTSAGHQALSRDSPLRDMWHRMKKDNTPGLSANCVEEILEGLQFNYTLLDSTYRALLRKAPKRNRYAEVFTEGNKTSPPSAGRGGATPPGPRRFGHSVDILLDNKQDPTVSTRAGETLCASYGKTRVNGTENL
ncbi:hypothetical protein QR680_012989 [Steinernema hermaphroditum]|uniref:Uncharacterized protein n=1 Tax=Steinernema hermaphroditum TaxID=289476 RepID=A0AA39I622_9BILA|nr:hypothetical protein QR680_012989 [Steinernema hermaphroditum]